MGETAEARLKRMAMRSWRRGTKEMDLVLGPLAEAHLARMSRERLDLYDVLAGRERSGSAALGSGANACARSIWLN